MRVRVRVRVGHCRSGRRRKWQGAEGLPKATSRRERFSLPDTCTRPFSDPDDGAQLSECLPVSLRAQPSQALRKRKRHLYCGCSSRLSLASLSSLPPPFSPSLPLSLPLYCVSVRLRWLLCFTPLFFSCMALCCCCMSLVGLWFSFPLSVSCSFVRWRYAARHHPHPCIFVPLFISVATSAATDVLSRHTRVAT